MRTTTTTLMLLAATGAFAQKGYKGHHNQMLDQAKVLLANEEYEQAAKLYKRLVPLDTTFSEVYHEMGLCLVNIPGRREEAVPHFERAVRGGHTDAYFELGVARHRQQRFDEAAELLRRYRQLNLRSIGDKEVDRRIAMALSAKALTQDPVEVTIRNMGPVINSPEHDYCPLVTADGNTMYLTSRRQGTTGSKKDGSGQWLEDIYTARRIDGIWTSAVNVRTPLNSPTHDATVGLNPDGSSMIVYRTNPNQTGGDLYETRLLPGGDWSEPKRMTDRINSKAHEPSASIAPGGDEIYFTSDRPGGYGGRDIYRIRRLPNGEWSLPLNLGPTVNTPYDEDGPFIHSDGMTLFFSSKGHNTMGGYDIFKTTLTDPDMNGWSTPVNMGHPINTVDDDIYFCLSEDGYTGWLSSERPGGLGMQDIYQVEFPGSQIEYVAVRGVVTDPHDEPVKARITVTDPSGEDIVGVYKPNERTGRYLLVLMPGQRYAMTVEAPGYLTRKTELHARAAEGTREMPMDILMVPDGERERLTRNE